MIDFSTASLLSYSHEPKFLGDSAFNYRIEKNYKIKGIIDNLLNSNGVDRTLSGVNTFLSSANDFNDIVIGGFNLGKGKVKSISFAGGNWVKMADYEATITIFDSGNLDNMTGQYYSGLQDSLYSADSELPLIQDLSESFSFSVDESNQYSFDHSLELKLISGGANTATCAKKIASGFLTNVAPFGFLNSQYSGFYARPSKRFYTESYDLINGKYNFSEKFSTKGSNPFYSFEVTHSFNLDKNGIATVSEEGKIIGIVETRFDYATSGYEEQQTGIFSRCSNFYNLYATGYYSGDDQIYPLVTGVREKSIESNKFDGSLSYSYRFDNDLNRNNSWTIDREKTTELNEDLVTFKTYIRGSVVGHGKVGTDEKINNAISGYNTILHPLVGGPTGVLLDKSLTFADYKGEVKYSYYYNASLMYMEGEILKMLVKTSTTPSFIDYNDIFMAGKLHPIQYRQDSLPVTSIVTDIVYRHQVEAYHAPRTLDSTRVVKDESYSFTYPGNGYTHSISYLG